MVVRGRIHGCVAVHSRWGSARLFSSTAGSRNKDSTVEVAKLSPRWLSDTKARLGKCLMFGMDNHHVHEAGTILDDISRNWKELVAGSEGFLTDPKRAGLSGHAVVWGEQDSMGHVNNVQYVRYAETGRTNWTRHIGEYFDVANKKLWDQMLTSKSYGLILKSITVDFKFPMTWPDKISVYHKLRSMPSSSDSSMLLDVMILSEDKQRPAARCLEDVSVYDYQAFKKSTLPTFMLEQFRKQFELQEQAKRENTAKVLAILEKVRWLETQTWDRPDAVEDVGSSGR